jgi:RNA polymerase sigma-70 factor (ECF subfamily)
MGGTRPDVETAVAGCLDVADLRGAATAAIRGYGPQILSYLRAVLRSDDAADEVFGTFCEHLWKGIQTHRRTSTVLAWCYGVAWGAVRRYSDDAYRRRKRRLRTTVVSNLAAEVRESAAPYLRSELQDRVAKLRQGLAPDEQTLLILRIDRKLSWREVVEVLATGGEPPTEAAVRKRFERIKEKLRRLAEAEGLLAPRGS